MGIFKCLRRRVKRGRKPDRQMRYFFLEQHYFYETMIHCADPVKGPIFSAKHDKYFKLVWEGYDEIYKRIGYPKTNFKQVAKDYGEKNKDE